MNYKTKLPKGVKRCGVCKIAKELSEYYRNKSKYDGRSTRCRVCELGYSKAYQKRNPEKFDKRKHYLVHIERRYGLASGEYDRLMAAQRERCAICQTHKDEQKRRLHVDHDHKTGKVRGLLCFGCNYALGALKDDTSLFQSAIDYLKKSQ